MTIIRTDLKIFKPELLGNEPFAGGYRTSNEVEDGKLNDVFSAISDIDHARSALDIVKLYPSVNTPDASRLQDAYVFISDQPEDPLVNTFIAETDTLTDADTLADIQAKMILDSTKFHGSSMVTAESSGKLITVENTQASIVPKLTDNEGTYGTNGFLFEIASDPNGAGFGFTREAVFTAQASSTKFFSLDLPNYYEHEPYAVFSYNDPTGKLISGSLLSPTLQNDFGIVFENGTLTCELETLLRSNSDFRVKYRSTQDYRHHSYVLNEPLVLAANEYIVKHSYRVKKAGTSDVFADNGSGLFADADGNVFAQLDYATGDITPPENVDLTSSIQDNLGCTVFTPNASNQNYPNQIKFDIDREGDLILSTLYLKITRSDDSVFSVSVPSSGIISHAEITGTAKPWGAVTLNPEFGVDVKRVDYDIEVASERVAQTDWYGFDVTQIKNAGIADVFHQNNVVNIQYKEHTEASTLTNNETISVLADADYINIADSDGLTLYTASDDNYTYDKATGDITIKSGVSAFTAPFVITAIQSERNTVVTKNDTELSLLFPLKRTYPVGSTVSSVVVLGDMQSLAKDMRTISQWRNYFDSVPGELDQSDHLVSAGTTAFNTTNYPIEFVNEGTVNQRWAIVFTGTDTFKVIGETLGVVATGDTLNDLVLVNPLTLKPFMIIRKEMFSASLFVGEAFLFETIAASKPTIVMRSVSPGHSTVENDGTTLAFFGNQSE